MALTKIDDRGLKTPIDLLDNEKIRFGTGNDLELYHDGSDNYLNSSNGHFFIRNNVASDVGGDIYIQAKSGEKSIKAVHDGGVELYYDNVRKFQTDPNGVLQGDNSWHYWGDSDDLYIGHNGTDSYIVNTTGALHIRNDGIYFKNAAGSENFIDCSPNAEVSLFYDNVKKFETIANGVQTNGSHFVMDGDGANGNPKFACGNGADLNIYHDGSNSYLVNTTGELRITDSSLIRVNTDDFRIYKGDGNELTFRAEGDGACSLYYDNSKKFETTSGGVNVTGALTVNGAALGGSSYTATADGAIAAGDPVSVATDGKLKKSGEVTFDANWTLGSTLTLGTEKREYTACAHDPHKKGRFAVVYTDDASNKYVRLQIVTVSGSTITKSSIYTVNSNSCSNPQVVFDHEAEGRVLCIYMKGSNQRRATLVNFTGSAGSESFSNVSGATEHNFGNNNAYTQNSGNQPAPLKYYGDKHYLSIYQRDYQSTSYYLTFNIDGDTIGTVQGGQFWAESTKSPAGFDLDPTDLKKGIASIARNSDRKWYMRTFEIAANHQVTTGSETYVTNSSSNNYRVSNDPGFHSTHYVAGGQFVLGTTVTDDTYWAGQSKSYHQVWIVIKVSGSNFTRSGYYYGPTDAVTVSSGNQTIKFVSANNPDKLYPLSVVSKFNANPLAYRIDVDTTNNTLSFSTQTQVVNSSNAMQFPTLAMTGDEDRSTLLTYADYGNNGYARVMQPGGPGNDLKGYIGLADSSVSSGASVTATIVGGKATTSGLTIGKRYYVQLDGTLGTSPATTDVTAGIALSATSLLVTT